MTCEFSKATMWNDYFKSCIDFGWYLRDRVNTKNVTDNLSCKIKTEDTVENVNDTGKLICKWICSFKAWLNLFDAAWGIIEFATPQRKMRSGKQLRIFKRAYAK